MTKKWCTVLLVSYLWVLLAAFTSPENKNVKTDAFDVLILDAGHGGSKPGAKGWNGYWEKDITLAIALETEKEIKKLLPGLRIIQTRTDDSDVDNRLRPVIANENKGDVFVSIHCNSVDGYLTEKELVDSTEKTRIVKNDMGGKDTITEMVPVYKNVRKPKGARGLETYVWNMAHNSIKIKAAGKSIADKENEEILNDPDYKEKYGEGMDINAPEFINKALLRTKKYFRRSVKLAEMVQEEGANAGRNDRAVKQRGEGIWVLQATNMPSILVETGYLSHPDEEAYLASAEGQHEMAGIIARAVKKYKDFLEALQKQTGENENGQNTPPAQTPANTPNTNMNKEEDELEG
jgi:N-acetylmuramoyl-L-alanine amidase